MDEKLDKLIRLLIDNGLSLNRVGDWCCCTDLELDFSEHDKVFEDKIASLEKQIEKLKGEKSFLRTRCMPYIERDFDNGLYGNLAIVGCNEEFVDIQKYADGDDLYSIEVRNLLSEGGLERLIGQYRSISRKLDKMSAENRGLQKKIAELESEKEDNSPKEPISDCKQPSIEWYDNRHQSDCIKINQLQTTIDVLIHKIEYLRQLAGLE